MGRLHRGHRLLGLLDVAAHVDLRGVEVHVDVAGQQAVLVADHGRALDQLDLGDLGHGDLALAARQGQEHAPERVEVLAKVAGVAHVHAVALAALDGGGLVVAAHRGHHHHVGVVDGQAVAGQLVAVEHEVEEVAAGHALGEHAAGLRQLLNRRLDLQGRSSESRPESAPLILMPIGVRMPVRQHVQPPLDGHGPGVADPGQTQAASISATSSLSLDAIAPHGAHRRDTPGSRADPEPGALGAALPVPDRARPRARGARCGRARPGPAPDSGRAEPRRGARGARELAPRDRLVATLLYGGGLRLLEGLRLRVKDIDIDRRQVLVRQGKGGRDRRCPFPVRLRRPLLEHLERVAAHPPARPAKRRPAYRFPRGSPRKYPSAGTDWEWYWLFPAQRARVHREPRAESTSATTCTRPRCSAP